jgi:cytoskeleton protein RodZ
MTTADTLQPLPGSGPVEAVPGARLSEARQALNLTAADIARQLKLSVWQVEALEAGRYQQLPGPIFVRGFIRNYARQVKLDPEALLRAAGDSLPQTAARAEAPPSHDIPFPTTQAPRWPKYAAAAVAIFGALAVYEFFWSEPDTAAARVAVVAPPPAAAKPGIGQAAPAPEQNTRMEKPAITIVATAMNEPAAQPAPAAPDLVVQPPAKAPGERQVKLVFDQESWVEIRDRREKIIFSQLNRPGTVQEVSGLPPLSVVVGNAHGVRMTYEDQPVDLARHTKIDVARLTLE